MWLHDEQVYNRLMFYLLLLSSNRDLCIIPIDMLHWLNQLEVKQMSFKLHRVLFVFLSLCHCGKIWVHLNHLLTKKIDK